MATMSTVWDRTSEFLSENLGAIMPVVLVALFLPLSLWGALNPLAGTLGVGGNAALGVVMLVLSLATVWGNIAISALALDPAGGRAPAIAAANRLLLPVTGIFLLLFVGVIVLMVPIGVALGLSGLDMNAMSEGRVAGGEPHAGVAVFLLLYLPFVSVALLWLSARLSLIVPIMVMERRGVGVFARSFVLTRPAQWRIVGVLILYLIVSLVASGAARTVFGSLFALMTDGEGPVTLATVLTATIVAGVSTLLSLLSIAFVARLYVAMRDRREAIVDGAVLERPGGSA